MARRVGGDDVTSLVEFLRARLDEDEQIARAAMFNNGRWRRTGQWAHPTSVARDYGPDVVPEQGGSLAWDNNGHIARHDPARVLADVAANRAILDAYAERFSAARQDGSDPPPFSPYRAGVVVGLDTPIKHLASVYADHPDYDQSWTVTP